MRPVCLIVLLHLCLLPRAVVSAEQPAARANLKVVLVIHGGAGVLGKADMLKAGLKEADFEQALAEALFAGYHVLQQKESTSVDAIEATIRVMEDCELFNAGRGAALNSDGHAELDAAIMEGNMTGTGEGKKDPRKRAGAVAAVKHIKNPISAARAVMEMKDQRHVMLVGEGAEWFALGEPIKARYKLERVSNAYFWTDRRLQQIRDEIDKETRPRPKGERGNASRYFGTVGAVAVKNERLAAGTSTGGLTNKLPGRVGDSPIIGAGTYADDRACGVSCTGTGEVFIRHAVAHDVVARMLYKKLSVTDAADETIKELPNEDGGVGGFIALDKEGRHAFAMSKRSDGMYRGYVTDKGEIFVAIYREDKEKPGRPEKGDLDKKDK